MKLKSVGQVIVIMALLQTAPIIKEETSKQEKTEGSQEADNGRTTEENQT